MPHWRWWVLVGLVDLNLDLLESGVEGALVRLEGRGEEVRGGGGLERTVQRNKLGFTVHYYYSASDSA